MGAVALTFRNPAPATEWYAVRGMTCGACVHHVEQALGAVPGVQSVVVELASATATVRRDASAAPVGALKAAVITAGFEIERTTNPTWRNLPWWPVGYGTVAALGMLAAYLGLLTWAQGWAHASQQFADDRPFVLALMTGFGVQVGLFAYVRALHARASASMTAASTGTSTGAMLACCAHHLVDVLPVIGLAGAATFLSTYRTELLWLGVATNLAGVAYMALQVRKARRMACQMPAPVVAVPATARDPGLVQEAACH